MSDQLEVMIENFAAVQAQRDALRAELEALKAAQKPVSDEWLFMRHPTRMNGAWIPARRFTECGVEWFQIWEENVCEFEWSERDEDWEILDCPVPAAAVQKKSMSQWEIQSIANELWQIADSCGFEQFYNAFEGHMLAASQVAGGDA